MNTVAPLAGAWIEMIIIYLLHMFTDVAPLAGAWIEILKIGMVKKLK